MSPENDTESDAPQNQHRPEEQVQTPPEERERQSHQGKQRARMMTMKTPGSR